MSWWIFILFYLWQNSLRRWWEQPLSLLSKLVVSALLGILGAVVILGIRHLGEELDRRLNDREVLTAVLTEGFPKDATADELLNDQARNREWRTLDEDAMIFYQAGASARTREGDRLPVLAVPNLEQHGLVDDFYVLSDSGPEDEEVEFEIADYWSEARRRRPSKEMEVILYQREALIGGTERLGEVLASGFNKSIVLRGKSVEDVQRFHDVVDAIGKTEGRRILIQSNLKILRELQKMRGLQAEALLWITLGSSAVLGLVFGSLAWMEFREERYLLSLIRSFGVGRITLLAHAVVENCLLAVAGVLIGFGVLGLTVKQLNLAALKLTWLSSVEILHGPEGRLLLLGAAVGGLLSCVPIGIGLRKPLGLVLK